VKWLAFQLASNITDHQFLFFYITKSFQNSITSWLFNIYCPLYTTQWCKVKIMQQLILCTTVLCTMDNKYLIVILAQQDGKPSISTYWLVTATWIWIIILQPAGLFAADSDHNNMTVDQSCHISTGQWQAMVECWLARLSTEKCCPTVTINHKLHTVWLESESRWEKKRSLTGPRYIWVLKLVLYSSLWGC